MFEGGKSGGASVPMQHKYGLSATAIWINSRIATVMVVVSDAISGKQTGRYQGDCIVCGVWL